MNKQQQHRFDQMLENHKTECQIVMEMIYGRCENQHVPMDAWSMGFPLFPDSLWLVESMTIQQFAVFQAGCVLFPEVERFKKDARRTKQAMSFWAKTLPLFTRYVGTALGYAVVTDNLSVHQIARCTDVVPMPQYASVHPASPCGEPGR